MLDVIQLRTTPAYGDTGGLLLNACHAQVMFDLFPIHLHTRLGPIEGYAYHFEYRAFGQRMDVGDFLRSFRDSVAWMTQPSDAAVAIGVALPDQELVGVDLDIRTKVQAKDKVLLLSSAAWDSLKCGGKATKYSVLGTTSFCSMTCKLPTSHWNDPEFPSDVVCRKVMIYHDYVAKVRHISTAAGTLFRVSGLGHLFNKQTLPKECFKHLEAVGHTLDTMLAKGFGTIFVRAQSQINYG